CVELVERTKCITHSHHAHPRNERVDHSNHRSVIAQNRKRVKRLVQEYPKLLTERWSWSAWPVPTGNTDGIEQVVKRDHKQPDRRDHALRQVDQHGENNHRDPDDPDHLQEPEEPNVRIKEDAELYERQLEKDQPEPARHQKPRQLGLALAACKL